jgi:hypothetical protein
MDLGATLATQLRHALPLDANHAARHAPLQRDLLLQHSICRQLELRGIATRLLARHGATITPVLGCAAVTASPAAAAASTAASTAAPPLLLLLLLLPVLLLRRLLDLVVCRSSSCSSER